MVYKRPRKSARGTIEEEKYVEACRRVIGGEKNRSVARDLGMCHMTLARYVKKYKETETVNTGYKPYNKVFTEEREKELVSYCTSASKLYFGLTTKDLRKLAYEFAKHLKLNFPSKWEESQMASIDWYKAFMQRNPILSVRRPQATSLARAMNFNKPNVEKFYRNLAELLDRWKFRPENMYNIDETGVTTSQKPHKVLAEKGTKQVGAITSQERGTLVTVCLAVNAIGNAVPPFFVFPRKNFHQHFLRNGPTGCSGSANKSGWMQEEDFLLFMQHFKKFAKPNEYNRVLVVMDNHSSHISLPVINFCRENFIAILSFPPHTSHKLQPLDRSVFGPFKTKFNIAADHWMRNHPGERMTIYDLPELVKSALLAAATASNIIAGFQCTGIYPFNDHIFEESDFAPASITDMPYESSNEPQAGCSKDASVSNIQVTEYSSQDREIPLHKTPPTSPTTRQSLEDIKPLPKAQYKKKSKIGRAKGKTAIYTDTPEKEALEEEKKRRDVKKIPKLPNHLTTKRRRQEKKSVDYDYSGDSSEEETTICLVCCKPYSKSKEDWLQCTDCRKWAHSSCANNDPYFICLNCLSE
ncbi:tigger transposable element-derived protein 6-like [Photinus pyralis]|uniref:tigger transposable element-derived protein 6-like n=1 Tax=Photinus pyralis TaxID=7054 RepID=UPI001266FE28|nr:tigger transposable element-derived protein 6-like [Photinus pyralis]